MLRNRVRAGRRSVIVAGMRDPTFHSRYGPWALIAGGSEGIGAAFADAAAANGLNVLLLARRLGPLEETAAQLRARHDEVRIEVQTMDLGAPDLPDQVAALARSRPFGFVVYNAARSLIGPFDAQSLEDKLSVIDVNCRGPVIFADTFGPPMKDRGKGGLVILSSLAGLQGSALVSTYAASKAFDLVLGEGLWEEWRRSGVDALAVVAGATRTPGYLATAPDGKRAPEMEPDEVVREAIDAIGRVPSVVVGRKNRMAALAMGRVMSRHAAVRTMGRAMWKLYGGRG